MFVRPHPANHPANTTSGANQDIDPLRQASSLSQNHSGARLKVLGLLRWNPRMGRSQSTAIVGIIANSSGVLAHGTEIGTKVG